MSVFPSPVKSAGVGMSVDEPNAAERTDESDDLETHHSPPVAPFGRKIATSVFPSPSKSYGFVPTLNGF